MNLLPPTFAITFTTLALWLTQGGPVVQRVDAGGPMLRLLTLGRGQPTVVFEAGAGGTLEVWARVQPEVSRFATTISYDRAGNGLSSRGKKPRDGERIAIELHNALGNAHVPPPYVLVGHSLGGPFVRIFAGLYPQEVAGLVLVDPTQEELIAWARAREPKPASAHLSKPGSEVACAPTTFAQAQAHPVPSHLPVRLISGQGPRRIPGFLTRELREELAKDQHVLYPAKLEFHRRWMEAFPEGRLIVAADSGHGIPLEEPDLIVRVIRGLIAQRDVAGTSPTR